MFTGEMADTNDLMYLRARYYAPELGVFTGLDPVEFVNRYQYVGANPTNFVDPSGHEFWRPRGGGRWNMLLEAIRIGVVRFFDGPQLEVQSQYMATAPDDIHAEYPIPVKKLRKKDLCLEPKVQDTLTEALEVLAKYWSYVDLLREPTAEIWEIKPQDYETQALKQVLGQLTALTVLGAMGELKGDDHPVRGVYDWNNQPWQPGWSYPQTPVLLGRDTVGNVYYVRQAQKGVILWWKARTNNRVRVPELLPIPVPLRMANNERNVGEHPDEVYDPETGGVKRNPVLKPGLGAASRSPAWVGGGGLEWWEWAVLFGAGTAASSFAGYGSAAGVDLNPGFTH